MNKKCLYFRQIKHIQLKIDQHPAKRLKLELKAWVINERIPWIFFPEYS